MFARDANGNLFDAEPDFEITTALEWLDYSHNAPEMPMYSDTDLLTGEFGKHFYGR